jgi:hypothetical protein
MAQNSVRSVEINAARIGYHCNDAEGFHAARVVSAADGVPAMCSVHRMLRHAPPNNSILCTHRKPLEPDSVWGPGMVKLPHYSICCSNRIQVRHASFVTAMLVAMLHAPRTMHLHNPCIWFQERAPTCIGVAHLSFHAVRYVVPGSSPSAQPLGIDRRQSGNVRWSLIVSTLCPRLISVRRTVCH